jgi:hypothetical protein
MPRKPSNNTSLKPSKPTASHPNHEEEANAETNEVEADADAETTLPKQHQTPPQKTPQPPQKAHKEVAETTEPQETIVEEEEAEKEAEVGSLAPTKP